jgi:exosortase/archaeosortase family protein
MAMNRVIFTSTSGRWQARLDAMPPLGWLGLQAVALWPHWRWVASRVADGSDDPLGIAALAALLFAVVKLGPSLRASPRPEWLACAVALSVAATLAQHATATGGALLAALAMCAGLRAFMPSGQPVLPLAGLAMLALPVIASLQFYAGYPLRVVTAQCSAWALQWMGMAAERTGSAMQVEGRMVIVDAPCSGVQMVWMAYFCACAVAALNGLSDRGFLRRLPWLGVLVLLGNVLRNSVLVALEARQAHVPEALHQGVGLGVLALVCTAVVLVIRRDEHA